MEDKGQNNVVFSAGEGLRRAVLFGLSPNPNQQAIDVVWGLIHSQQTDLSTMVQ